MRIPAIAGSGRGGTPLSSGEATAILRRCGFFTGVAEPILEQLAALAELLEIPSGATLFE